MERSDARRASIRRKERLGEEDLRVLDPDEGGEASEDERRGEFPEKSGARAEVAQIPQLFRLDQSFAFLLLLRCAAVATLDCGAFALALKTHPRSSSSSFDVS